jgi:hypothetical protein
VSAASARVRVANYIPFLRDHEVELTHVPTISDDEYALLASDAGPSHKAAIVARSARRGAAIRRRDALLLVHRLLLLTPIPGIDPPRALDVYDFDDALLVGSAAAANSRFQWTKQEARRAVACMRRARLVLTGNVTLAAQARAYARHVEVLPSCVDPAVQPQRDHLTDEPVTIGWIGSHTTVDYLKSLLPVIARLHERGMPIRLVVVGGDTGASASWVEHRHWSLETQAADLASFDVGVMPLPDTDWTRGKSGYKLLQYFAAGVPAVASPVGVNAEFVRDGRGIPATTEGEWEHALTELVRDAQGRAQRGAAARHFVEQHYSYQRWAPELARLLRDLRA